MSQKNTDSEADKKPSEPKKGKKSTSRTQTNQLGFDLRDGFWFDYNTFIMPDKAEVVNATRENLNRIGKKTEKASIVVFSNATEMIVDDKGKIVDVQLHSKLGLWLDAVRKAVRRRYREESA